MLAPILMAISASIIGLLGLVHLVLTFRGPKLWPRDRSLQKMMDQVSPVITKETTLWRMWIGFNASHSLGALLFGLNYGYLALFHGEFLFRSGFLLGLGLAMLVSLVVLAKLYWFFTPQIGISLSLILYGVSIVIAWMG